MSKANTDEYPYCELSEKLDQNCQYLKYVILITTMLCVIMMEGTAAHLWFLMKCALWGTIAIAILLEKFIEALKQVTFQFILT